jgi:HTH-type transcriptional regulator/antitoxin HigA
MSAHPTDYAELLRQTQPAVIHAEEQNRQYLGTLEHLAAKPDPTAAEAKLIELLTLLIEQYEAQAYPLPHTSPTDIIRHLMEAHHLRQKDLVGIFETESIVSAVLNGKRELTRDHIKRLSERFSVSPAVFF